ncbi:hypothetical protein DID88_000658 [Monilinia fructigena]|uniref:Uncharacterized protein n=1 Tax=Monilinia fructigena TaxID=38457 RepID=A0A395II73_9HELO|nr:hypothetical protein DID88_000658 [Monilinia fructigena]
MSFTITQQTRLDRSNSTPLTPPPPTAGSSSTATPAAHPSPPPPPPPAPQTTPTTISPAFPRHPGLLRCGHANIHTDWRMQRTDKRLFLLRARDN